MWRCSPAWSYTYPVPVGNVDWRANRSIVAWLIRSEEPLRLQGKLELHLSLQHSRDFEEQRTEALRADPSAHLLQPEERCLQVCLSHARTPSAVPRFGLPPLPQDTDCRLAGVASGAAPPTPTPPAWVTGTSFFAHPNPEEPMPPLVAL